jgi:hypothetical protein
VIAEDLVREVGVAITCVVRLRGGHYASLTANTGHKSGTPFRL